MKITAIDTLHIDRYTFVQVHTDEGITGLGEASHSGNDALLLAALLVALGLAGAEALFLAQFGAPGLAPTFIAARSIACSNRSESARFSPRRPLPTMTCAGMSRQ